MDKQTRYFSIAWKLMSTLVVEVITLTIIKAIMGLCTLLSLSTNEIETVARHNVVIFVITGFLFLVFLFLGFYERYRD